MFFMSMKCALISIKFDIDKNNDDIGFFAIRYQFMKEGSLFCSYEIH